MNRAFKFRIYPSKQQENLIQRTFGCCRLVYNRALALKKETYEKEGKSLNRMDLNNLCNREWKEELSFLREVDKFALTNSIYHLSLAYDNCFKKNAKKPKFKSKKKAKKAYTTNRTGKNIRIEDNAIRLPKLGFVKAVIHRKAPENWVIKSATVSQEADGRYYVSVLYEYEETVTVSVDESKVIGLDYKSNGLFADSKGNTADVPHFYRRTQKRLVKQQRKLSKKAGNKKNEKKSKNYIKQQSYINKTHRKIANQRKDYLHKLSAEITNQHDIICVENLDMRALSNKGFGNGKATMDNGYGMFLRFVEYKQQEKGHVLIKVDKFYASSQLCSCCGHKQKLKLSDRTYICPSCGLVIDRDTNAAKNIETEGLRIYREAA